MRDALTAARDWGVRPTEMLGAPVPGGGWSEADRLLAVARTLDDQARCPCGCGHYRDETFDVDDGTHDVGSIICDARAALDLYERDHPKREPGELRFAFVPDD